MLTYDFTNACAPIAGLDDAALAALRRRLDGPLEALRALYAREEESFLASPNADSSSLVAMADDFVQSVDTVVVLGIGGSSLGAKAVHSALVRPYSGAWRNGAGGPRVRLVFLETVDPVEVSDVLDTVDWRRAAVNVVTKSGGTVETMSAFFAVRQRLIELGGLDFYRSRVVATTDPDGGVLRRLARDDGLRTLAVPPGVGGRFSVFTPVGLFPLAAAGVDVTAFCDGAAAARDAALTDELSTNPAAAFSAVQVALLEAGVHDVAFMPYVGALEDVAAWFVQLWAESLGKIRDGVSVGPTPIRAVGPVDQHSQLQLFVEGPATKNVVFVETRTDPDEVVVPDAPLPSCADLAHLGGQTLHAIRDAELAGVRAALAEAKRPTSTFSLGAVDAASLGQLLMTLACSTALAGGLMGIDPFDQPGVELAKKFAHGILGRDAEAPYRDRLDAATDGARERVSRLG